MKACKETEGQTGSCQGFEGECGQEGKVQRQNTAYEKNELNWVCMCEECATANDYYWQKRWNEFYSDLL